MGKSPDRSSGLSSPRNPKISFLDIGPSRNPPRTLRRKRWQFHGKSHFTLVAQNAEFHRLVLSLGRKLLAQKPERTDALAVQRGKHAASLQPRLLCPRPRTYLYNESSLTIRRTKIRA